jgi:hypothetical protein
MITAIPELLAPETLGEMDQLVMETILRRMEGIKSEPVDGPAEPEEESE